MIDVSFSAFMEIYPSHDCVCVCMTIFDASYQPHVTKNRRLNVARGIGLG